MSERDYIERTIATVRNHRGADNCWPQWANIFADEIESLWARVEAAEEILRRATAPRRPDGTYNYSREAFEQMANDYFAVVVPVEKQPPAGGVST